MDESLKYFKELLSAVSLLEVVVNHCFETGGYTRVIHPALPSSCLSAYVVFSPEVV